MLAVVATSIVWGLGAKKTVFKSPKTLDHRAMYLNTYCHLSVQNVLPLPSNSETLPRFPRSSQSSNFHQVGKFPLA